ncbi:MAG: glycosyltransferase family 4 protein [Planctomycetota bacterium]
MRVLITSPVFPPDLGGPATYVPSISRWLVERGHEVKVVAFCSDPKPSGYPFEVVSILPASIPMRYGRAFFAVWREARSCDVVYVNEHLALLHVLAARLAGKPVVIRIMVDGAWEIAHRYGWCGGDDIVKFQGRSYGWKVGLTRRLQRSWWKAATHIIACSEFLRQILIRTYGVPPGKVELVHNSYSGPPPDAVRQTPAEARSALGLSEDKRYLLTICRLVVWKRVDAIIESLAKLPADVQLLVAGDGDMLESWKELALRLGLADRVHFLGNVPHDRIPLLIRASEVFVLNSEYEGLSHTLIEVQTLGTPIVASNVCGNPEVVSHGETGFLVDPRQTGELTDALSRLLSDQELRARFRTAGLASSQRFRRDAVFPKVEAALRRASGTRG